MSKQVTLLMCSPRKKQSASYSLGSYVTSLLEEKGITAKIFQIYNTLRDSDKIDEMVKAIDASDILVLSSPLYVDSAPFMTIKLMNLIAKEKQEGKIRKKERLILAISNAGYLEYFHNNIAIRIYEQFAKENEFTWAGGLPIGAAGMYTSMSISDFLKQFEGLPEEDPRHEYFCKPARILDFVIKTSVDYLSKGEIVPRDELQKLEFISMPLQAYADGGNKNWIGWAEQLGTKDKLRDKPYEVKK
ncbi:MAG: NAD(P)H-dependent oxidoreductase [Candidatus Heimdallarchaeota archaeon]|nr:NAD(P)H-dependent oxidoreductase [Candidatus Heimdallarchaeota archaeon]MCK4954620.1 NAD(P)H-dependent oxidoreductase [Candidatus Heimdallarchaeota archaeon]